MSGKNDRKKMIREAKNYQRERKLAEEKSRRNRPAIENETVRNLRNANKNVKKNIPEDLSSDIYNDDFFVDESKYKKEKAEKLKKQQNKKAPLSPKRRRVKHIITYVVIFSVILIIGIILSLTVLFKTEKINIEGNTLYDEQQIIQLSSVQMEQNIFLAKFGSTPEKIEEILPYIEEARVDFKIPDTITITVKNAEPAYVVVSNNQFYKVSAKGRILEVSNEYIDDLPITLCSDIKNTQVGKYIEYADENINKILNNINNCIAENGYEGISYIDVRDPANINMIYDNRIKIIISLPEDIEYKLKTAMTIILEKLDKNGAVEAEGTLNVSECNKTKKSYFKDEKISIDVTIPTIATQPLTTQPTSQTETEANTEDISDDSYTWVPADDGGYSSADDGGGDYSGGNSDDGYSGDDYSSDGYSGDNYGDNYSGDGYLGNNYGDNYGGDGYSGDYSSDDGNYGYE